MSLVDRLKPLLGALLVTALLWTVPALAAGTLPLALVQQSDINGQPLAGCQVLFYVAGTAASPQNAFADYSLTQSLGPQLFCDQTGRVPMFWLADGLVHVRLTDATGLQVLDTTMQVLGPSSGGGGGGGTVDPTSVLATGDLKFKYGFGPLSGFVRMNGLSIGNTTSGATERANADTQALFVYLYGVDPNLAVSGGRTGNALNDYNANKTMATPDWRGRLPGGLDDMGNVAAGRLTAAYFGANATVLGAAGGNEANTLTVLNLPPYTPAGSVSVVSNRGDVTFSPGTTDNYGSVGGACCLTGQSRGSLTSTGLLSGTPQGGANAPFRTTPPIKLATFYIKL